MAHVLVSPLNWGLGHATRDIPVIRTLLAHGHEVTIAACGSALSVLRQEFPDARSIEYPDYPFLSAPAPVRPEVLCGDALYAQGRGTGACNP